jgi:hypothetical protein
MTDNQTGCSEPECGVPAELVRENGFCDAHGPNAEEEMSARGRKGAEANAKVLDPGVLLPVDSADDVLHGAAQLADAVASGRVSESRARAAKKCLKLALDGLEARAALDEYQQVQAQLEEIHASVKRDPDPAPWER